MSIKKITLTLDDKEVTLEWEEAKKLYEELYSIFGDRSNTRYLTPYFTPSPWYVSTGRSNFIKFITTGG